MEKWKNPDLLKNSIRTLLQMVQKFYTENNQKADIEHIGWKKLQGQ